MSEDMGKLKNVVHAQRRREEYWLPEDVEERGPNPWAGFAGLIGYAALTAALTGGAIAFIEAMCKADVWLDEKWGLGAWELGGGLAGLSLIAVLLGLVVRRMRRL